MIKLIKKIFHYELHYLSLQLISLFSGFFISTILSTMPAQTGDWGIIAGSIIVTLNEIISRIAYRKQNFRPTLLDFINAIKIGIIYGLFVDAFKLGS